MSIRVKTKALALSVGNMQYHAVRQTHPEA